MPKWMDDCVASYKKKHPDADEDKAWRICTAAYKKKFGHSPDREDVIMPQLMALQERVGTEGTVLRFSDAEKRELLQRAVHELFDEPDEYGYVPWTDAWYITAVYDSHVVVSHKFRLYAVPYEVVDHGTVELGKPEEVVSAHVSAEAEIWSLMMNEGWLPQGLFSPDLMDTDFVWLSDEYLESEDKTKLNRREHRKLPYKVLGEPSVEGWISAWLQVTCETYLRPDLVGGPGREQAIRILKENMPDGVALSDTGNVELTEDTDEAVLFEGQIGDFIVEEATAEEKEKFALVFSGNVIPRPDTEYGVQSVNNRLYPAEAIAESYKRSLDYIKEGGVATVYTSHAAASYSAGRLPIGRVLDYSHEGGALRFRGGIVETAEGADAMKLLEAGVLGTVSLRSYDWESHTEEVDGLGKMEVIDWCVIKGIDFATSPGLPGTQVTKEEQAMKLDLSELTLEQLQEERPDLVTELVAGIEPEPQPVDEAERFERAVLEAACTGMASVVAAEIRERAEGIDQIPEVLAEARQAAISRVYAGRHGGGEPENLKGEGTPPEPPEEEEEDLSDTQKSIVENAGGTV